MTGLPWAAAILALAVLVSPPPRRMLAARRTWVRPRWLLPAVCASSAACAAVVLPITTVAAGALISVTVLTRRRERLRRSRIAAEGKAMTGVLETLVAELRVGSAPVRAFDAAALDAPAPLNSALRDVAARAGLGADVAAGLRSAGRRSALVAEWDRLALSWSLAAEHGLAIAALMRSAQLDIVERLRFSAQVDAAMAGVRATAVILAALPPFGILLGEAMGAAPLAFLTGGGPGGWCLVIGTALLCAGLWWADRITGRLPT